MLRQAIPLNIDAGKGKATDGDRRRYFEIARVSALECGAIQDVLEVCGALSAGENVEAKAVLDRIVAMPTKLARRGYTVREAPAETNFVVGIDSDADSDSDPEAKRGRTTACSGRAERRAAEAWRWAFEPGSPARHSSRGPRGRIGR